MFFFNKGGVYTFNIFNTYAVSGWSFLGLIFFECIAVSWFYGINYRIFLIKKFILCLK